MRSTEPTEIQQSCLTGWSLRPDGGLHTTRSSRSRSIGAYPIAAIGTRNDWQGRPPPSLYGRCAMAVAFGARPPCNPLSRTLVACNTRAALYPQIRLSFRRGRSHDFIGGLSPATRSAHNNYGLMPYQMKRPNGLPSRWSIEQTSRWIRYLVKSGMVEFDQAGHSLRRGDERGVSNAEVLKVVEFGRALRKESAFVRSPGGGFEEERVTFEYEFRSRPGLAIGVVAGVSDTNPNCVIVTCWTKKKR